MFVIFFIMRPFTRLRALGRLDKAAVYPSVSSWTIATLMIAVFGVAYGIDSVSFALLGICNALISSPQPMQNSAIVMSEEDAVPSASGISLA
jgi:hypothetical protein